MLPTPNPFKFIQSLLRIITRKPQVPPSLKDNTLLNVIMRRRSVRSYRSDDISDDIFCAILEAGRVAPSTVNLQSWSFATFTAASWRATFNRSIPFKVPRAVIIMGDTRRDRLALGTEAIAHSPLVEYTIAVMNASLAAMAMNLAAEALGVSSVMLSETGQSGLLDAEYLAAKLHLPPGVFPLMTIVFGYAAGAYPPMPPRLPMDTVCFDGAAGYREPAPGVLQDWLAQMIAGYKASHLTSSFQAQLRLYKSKIGKAEADLHRMILGESTAGKEGE
jgi:nitroreductase